MPSRRSTSKEREKKRKQREKMTEEQRQNENSKEKIRKRELRNSYTEEEKKEKRIAGKSKAEQEYLRIEKKHNMREKRKLRSGKEHLTQNLQAKQGMASLNEEGRKKEFTRRSGGKTVEKRDWELFFKSGNNAARMLCQRKPDIVEQINAKVRQEKEMERKQKETVEENGGEWLYNGEMGEWYWSGENEPVTDNFEYETYSDGELAQIREHERQEDERAIAYKKEEIRKSRQLKNEQRKQAMATPVEPLPERELCAYERYREENIREREIAMAECGFFDDLASFKSEIGLVEESVISDKKSDSSDESGKEVKKIKKGKKLCDIRENKLTRKQFHHEKARSDGVTNHEPSEEKEKTDSPAAKKHQESKKPWYENFHVDEWHLHDCFE